MFVCFVSVLFLNDTATTEIYTLSLHDALPISFPDGDRVRPGVDPALSLLRAGLSCNPERYACLGGVEHMPLVQRCRRQPDRKSTRLNSSHANISYAVFCLIKKKNPCHICRLES